MKKRVMILKARPWRFLALGLLNLCLCGLGAVLVARGKHEGWAVCAGFGLSAGACVLLSATQRGSLRIDPHGLTCRSFLRSRSWRWPQIEGFRAARFGLLKVVQVTVRDSRHRTTAWVLPDTYGFCASDLAAYLTDRWKEYLGA